MDRTTPEIIRAVEANLERKLSSVLQPSEMSRVGGVDPLVNIINRSDRVTERQIVEGLESLDAELADEVRSRMFMFEDIVTSRTGRCSWCCARSTRPSWPWRSRASASAVRDQDHVQPLVPRGRDPHRGGRPAGRRSA